MRTNELVRNASTYATRRNHPFLGHKMRPLICGWPGFDFMRMTPGEVFHDSKIMTDMIVKTTVGKGKSGTTYANWNKDAKHRAQNKILGIFESTWPENNGALPWRLSKDDKIELETRMKNVIWPHYMERLYYRGKSFWSAPSRMWKARRKFRLLYFMILTQLRGKVPSVHRALMTFVWSMRQMDGQVHSHEAAVAMNILPGSRSFKKTSLPDVKRLMVLGLSLIEGTFPIGSLAPGIKHFVHYPQYTGTHGILRILWMASFEM